MRPSGVGSKPLNCAKVTRESGRCAIWRTVGVCVTRFPNSSARVRCVSRLTKMLRRCKSWRSKRWVSGVGRMHRCCFARRGGCGMWRQSAVPARCSNRPWRRAPRPKPMGTTPSFVRRCLIGRGNLRSNCELVEPCWPPLSVCSRCWWPKPCGGMRFAPARGMRRGWRKGTPMRKHGLGGRHGWKRARRLQRWPQRHWQPRLSPHRLLRRHQRRW